MPSPRAPAPVREPVSWLRHAFAALVFGLGAISFLALGLLPDSVLENEKPTHAFGRVLLTLTGLVFAGLFYLYMRHCDYCGQRGWCGCIPPTEGA